MTNVPQDIRDMWKDVYVLFDSHYNMPNTPESWKAFWEKTQEIQQKYNNPHLGTLMIVVSDMIEYHITQKMLHPCTLEDTAKF